MDLSGNIKIDPVAIVETGAFSKSLERVLFVGNVISKPGKGKPLSLIESLSPNLQLKLLDLRGNWLKEGEASALAQWQAKSPNLMGPIIHLPESKTPTAIIKEVTKANKVFSKRQSKKRNK